jgi:hypothetical protein
MDLLAEPVTVMRKGRTRTIRRVQSCWFTGGIITNFTKEGDDRWTSEHIVPSSSELFSLLTTAQRDKNIVPAYAHANTAAANYSIVLKYVFRDRLRMALYGTTDLNTVPLEDRVKWSKELRALINRTAAEVFDEYRLKGKWFWTNPVVVPAEGIQMWTLANPHHKWTPADLNRRNVALETLRAASKAKLIERFGDFEYTDQTDAAIRTDLCMD